MVCIDEMSDLPDIEEMFNPSTKQGDQPTPPLRDLSALEPRTSRLSSSMSQTTSHKPFTNASTIPKPQRNQVKSSGSKGPVNLASSLKLVSENSVAKAQAAVEREKMKDERAQNCSQAIVDAAKIKHQPFQLQTHAMEVFAEGEGFHFETIDERLDAAQILRDDRNAAFFIQLSDELRWKWLIKEVHRMN